MSAIAAGRPFEPSFLLEFSAEHLFYEVQMFMGLANSATLPPRNQLEANCRIESFVIHLRNLVDFLYEDNPHPSDIVASDFVTKHVWSQVRHPLSMTLEAARVRANKEIAHLTTNRIVGTPARKAWDFESLRTEIVPILHRFIGVADSERLSHRVEEILR